jgi:hypothetical protein
MKKAKTVRWQFHLLVFFVPVLCFSLALLIGFFEDTAGKGMSFLGASLFSVEPRAGRGLDLAGLMPA